MRMIPFGHNILYDEDCATIDMMMRPSTLVHLIVGPGQTCCPFGLGALGLANFDFMVLYPGALEFQLDRFWKHTCTHTDESD